MAKIKFSPNWNEINKDYKAGQPKRNKARLDILLQEKEMGSDDPYLDDVIEHQQKHMKDFAAPRQSGKRIRFSPKYREMMGMEEDQPEVTQKKSNPEVKPQLELPMLPESVEEFGRRLQQDMFHPLEMLAREAEKVMKQSPEDTALQFSGGGVGHIATKKFLETFPEFANSVLKENDELIPLFHGTSKDKPFKEFKENQRGTFLTTKAEDASQYSIENESMDTVYNTLTRSFEDKNTASRVIPVYANVQKPYKLSDEELKLYSKTENYSKFQKDIMAKAKSQGYDAVDYGFGVIAVSSPKQLKSSLTDKK